MSIKVEHINHSQVSVFEETKHFLNQAMRLAHDWFERRKTRQQLAEMPSHLLRDIGLTEVQRQRELNKSFWL
jgi:uncharacterized protein YjiS (DUF1127 family)